MINNFTVLCVKAVLETFSLVISLCMKCRRNWFFKQCNSFSMGLPVQETPTGCWENTRKAFES